MPIDATKRALELELLARRLNELGHEARQIRGLENVTRRIFGVRGRVLELAALFRTFAKYGPDNEKIDPPRAGV